MELEQPQIVQNSEDSDIETQRLQGSLKSIKILEDKSLVIEKDLSPGHVRIENTFIGSNMISSMSPIGKTKANKVKSSAVTTQGQQIHDPSEPFKKQSKNETNAFFEQADNGENKHLLSLDSENSIGLHIGGNTTSLKLENSRTLKKEISTNMKNVPKSIMDSSIQSNNRLDMMGQLKKQIKDETNRTKETIDRMENFQRHQLSFDTPTNFFPNQEGKPASENKKLFLDNYGIKLQIPSLYIQKATFWPHDSSYAIKTQYYTLPKQEDYDEDLKIFIHELNGNRKETNFKQLASYNDNSVTIKIIQNQGNDLCTVNSVHIDKTSRILIKFSINGNLFAFYNQTTNFIKIFDIGKDIKSLVQKIKDDECLLSFNPSDTDRKDFNFNIIGSLKFDLNDRFISLNNDKQILVININSQAHEIHRIDQQMYDGISSMKMKSSDNQNYKLFVITNHKNERKVDFYDLNIKENVNKQSLNFFTDKSKYFQCKISNNLTTIVLVNMKENLLLQIKESKQANRFGKPQFYQIQKNLINIKGKIVKLIKCDPEGNGFYFMSHNVYDHQISITHSERDQYMLNIDRGVEPGIVSIFDIYLQIDFKDHKKKMEVRILNLLDEDFKYDIIKFIIVDEDTNKSFFNHHGSLEEDKHFGCSEIEVQTLEHLQLRGYCFHWPFFVYSNIDGNLIVFNAFEPNILNVVPLRSDYSEIATSKNFKILEMYITDTSDLIIAGRLAEKIQIYMIDLDKGNIKNYTTDLDIIDKNMYLPSLILEYPLTEVNNRKLTKIHARGSSRKDKINTNNKLILFILHEHELYSWIIMDEWSINDFKLTKVCDVKSNRFNSVNDSKFFMLQSLKENSKKIIFEKEVYNTSLIGRIESGLYTLADGHIYFSNNVIKIRYDLTDSDQSARFNDEQIFDFYLNIFDIEKTEQIKSTTPLQSHVFHRIAYIIYDKQNQSPKKILILPYLHDRKIYIKSHNKNTTYVYSSIETSVREEKEYHDKIEIENGLKKKDELPLKKSLSIKTLKMQKQVTEFQSIERTTTNEQQQSFTCILCNNVTENKIYVFSQNGVLLKKIFTRKFINDYGQIKQISQDQRNMLMKKSDEQISIMPNSTVEEKDLKAKQNLILDILHLSIFEIKWIKKISILDQINNQISDENQIWIQQPEEVQDLLDIIDISHIINLDVDVITKISRKNIEEYKQEDMDEFETFFIFEAGYANKTNDKMKSYKQEMGAYFKNSEEKQIEKNCIGLKGYQNKTIVMNQKYVFFQDKQKITYLELNKKWSKENIQTIGFNYSNDGHEHEFCDDQHGIIKEIQVGSFKERIIIVLQITEEIFQIVIWDIDCNTQISFFDNIQSGYHILWDNIGNPYILSGDKVIITENKTTTKAYRDLPIVQSHQMNKNFFINYDQGHRFDSNNHNWLILQEFLSLSFSYMSFVIKDKIETNDHLQKQNVFDLEPYNYIFNRSTSFLDGKFLKKDWVQLDAVLQNFYKIDKELLLQLNYAQGIRLVQSDQNITGFKTALSLAYSSGNINSTERLLKYMAHVDQKNLSRIMDILPELIKFEYIHDFLDGLLFQTYQMKKKLVQKVREPLNQNIVAITHCRSCIITDDFYVQNMNEISDHLQDESLQNYPVKVCGVPIDWLMNQKETDSPLKFLKSLIEKDNVEVFKIKSVEMIVELLFSNFRVYIYRQQVPIFVIQVICFFLQIAILEHIDNKFEGEVSENMDPNKSQMLKEVLTYINYIGFALQIYQFFSNFKHISYWKNMAGTSVLFSLFFIIINIILNGLIYLQLSDSDNSIKRYSLEYIRTISAIVMLLQLYRLGSFVTLQDQISPLIDIIFKIFRKIRYFMIIFVIALFFLSGTFYLIGKNQADFGELSPEEIVDLPYKDILKSILYVTKLSFGEINIEPFQYGKNQRFQIYLIIFFYISVLIMLIGLLNILIAIMGSIYNERIVVADQVRIRDHLLFVVDNWYLLDIAFKDRHQTKYIVCSFLEKQELNENMMLSHLYKEVSGIKEKVEVDFDETKLKQKELHDVIEKLDKKVYDLNYNVKQSCNLKSI